MHSFSMLPIVLASASLLCVLLLNSLISEIGPPLERPRDVVGKWMNDDVNALKMLGY